MIRTHMLGILIDREFRRLKKNPSAILLIGLLSAVALLLATSDPVSKEKAATPAPVFWMTYDEDSPWIEHLLANVPQELRIETARVDKVKGADRFGVDRPLAYPAGHHGIEIRDSAAGDGGEISITGRFSGDDPAVLQPFWNWFWPTVAEFHTEGVSFDRQLVQRRSARGQASNPLAKASVADLITAELVGTVLLLIVQFFSCCHLQVAFTSQDRERGTLTALALSPATTAEILTAKYIFHLALSLSGCAIIVAILRPMALMNPVFWIVLTLTSIGLLSVGTCMATLARTQAAAGLLALCYMLGGAVIFYLAAQFTGFALLKQCAFESYSFPLLYLTLKGKMNLILAMSNGLFMMGILVGLWTITARHVFTRYGWR